MRAILAAMKVPPVRVTTPEPAFDMSSFLASANVPNPATTYKKGQAIFMQGDACTHVLYVQTGSVKVSALSATGREAVVALLGPGAFFAEGCLLGPSLHNSTAKAMTECVIVAIPKQQMLVLLRQTHEMSSQFITHLLTRNGRIESDLIDQLFNSTEKRLARALLMLAGYGTNNAPALVVPQISQATLADMIGATRSRVNLFLIKFRKLGFISYRGMQPLTINRSLVSVLLHDEHLPNEAGPAPGDRRGRSRRAQPAGSKRRG